MRILTAIFDRRTGSRGASQRSTPNSMRRMAPHPNAPHCAARGAASGFTLLEILSVVGIMSLLMGLIGSAAFSARQRAYTATATTEAQQIAAALRAYYMAFREWPSGIGSGDTTLEESKLDALLGNNPTRTAFLQLPPDRIDEDTRQFLDPWGHPYVVTVEDPGEIEADTAYETVVSFPVQFGAYWQRY